MNPSNNSQRQFDFTNNIITKFSNKIRTSDILNMGFCKPFEVALKTSHINHNGPDDSLPQGLMQAVKKEGIFDNKFQLKPILPIPKMSPINPQQKFSRIQDLQQNNMNNYISLLKSINQIQYQSAFKNQSKISKYNSSSESTRQKDESIREQNNQEEVKNNSIVGKEMQIGICITMSSEDKQCLKKTLTGVVENVDKIIKSGVSPDDIFVVVVIDGMENVDKSLYEYFQILQLQSNIHFDSKTQLGIQEMYRQINRCSLFQEKNPILTNYFFNSQDIKDRIDFRPQSVISVYKQNLKQKQQVDKIFEQIRVNDGFRNNSRMPTVLNNVEDQPLLSKRMIQISRQRALYLNTREQLAYVCAYKLQTRKLSKKVRKQQDEQIRNIIKQQRRKIYTERMWHQRLLQTNRNVQRRKRIEEQFQYFDSIRYINLLFCIKYKQSGKLSSQNWFLNGFCRELSPKYSVIIDTGVCPGSDAIYKMYRCLKRDRNVGGVCSYIKLEKKRVYSRVDSEQIDCATRFFSCLFDLKKVQKIQNHFDYLVERPFEYVCGFSYSLPTSFSAYRMQALRESDQKGNLLKDYFKGVTEKVDKSKIKQSQLTVKYALMRFILPKFIWYWFITIDEDSEQTLLNNQNIYESQDHILCLGIQKCGKRIEYIPDSQVTKDCEETIHDFMHLRKREINGREQSLQKVRRELPTFEKNNKFCMGIMQGYLQFSRGYEYFSLFAFFILVNFSSIILKQQLMSLNYDIYRYIYITADFACQCLVLVLILGIIVLSLVLNYNHPKFKFYLNLISTILGIISFTSVTIVLIYVLTILEQNQKCLQRKAHKDYSQCSQLTGLFIYIFRFCTVGIICIVALPYLFYGLMFQKMERFIDLLKGMLSCVFFYPTVALIFPIYSKCRFDDISLAKSATFKNKQIKENWGNIKTLIVYKYLFWNIFACTSFALIEDYTIKFFVVTFVAVVLGLINFLKVFAALIYLLFYKCSKIFSPHDPAAQQIEQGSMENRCEIYQIIKRFTPDFLLHIRLQLELKLERERRNL